MAVEKRATRGMARAVATRIIALREAARSICGREVINVSVHAAAKASLKFVGYVGEIYQTESLSRQVTVTAIFTSKSMPHAA